MAVFVLDKRKRPLMPCREKRARLLLKRGRAVVVRLTPFTIRLKDRIGGTLQPLRLKLDPGSRTTGLALVRQDAAGAASVLWLGALTHRGAAIRAALATRRARRRRRRTAKLRHRPARFANRIRADGWLAPSLTLACERCNQRKGNRPIAVFLKDQPDLLQRLQAHAKAPLTDTAAVNATRWALFEALKATGLPVETGSGGRTKGNRARLGVPKTHALDAACVGPVDALRGWAVPSLAIRCTGRGRYQRTLVDDHGFPRGHRTRRKRVQGFQTGDRVCASVLTGKKAGVYVGRVAVRATGSFNIQTPAGVVQGISYRHCRVLQRADGYGYSFNPKPTEVASRGA